MAAVLLGVSLALGQEYGSPSRGSQSNNAAPASTRGRGSQSNSAPSSRGTGAQGSRSSPASIASQAQQPQPAANACVSFLCHLEM